MNEFRFHRDNLDKHFVTEDEVEECFLDQNRFVRRIGEHLYWLIGRTEIGRLLQIGYRREQDNVLFVFHAMNAKAHEEKRYRH